jgi:hypothetical protein
MSGKAVKDTKNDARWTVIMQKQDVKIQLGKRRVVVNKQNEDFDHDGQHVDHEPGNKRVVH